MGVLADLDPGARAALLLASEGFSGAEIASRDRPFRSRDTNPALPDPPAGSRTPRVPGGRPMKPHDTFLELAAIAIDFPLAPAERGRLEQHLAGCARLRAHGARAPGRCPGALPPAAGHPPGAPRGRDPRRRPAPARRPQPGPARWSSRPCSGSCSWARSRSAPSCCGAWTRDDLGVVLPVPSQAASPDASPAPTTSSAPSPEPSLGDIWAPASMPVVVGRPVGRIEAVTAGGPGFVAVGRGVWPRRRL